MVIELVVFGLVLTGFGASLLLYAAFLSWQANSHSSIHYGTNGLDMANLSFLVGISSIVTMLFGAYLIVMGYGP